MRTLAVLSLLAATATAAHAQDSRTQTGANRPSVSIGAGMMIKPDYSGADTYETLPLPMITASKEITPGNTLYLRGLEAGLDHAFDEQLTVGLVARYGFERDSSDSSRLTGMDDIDAAIEFGPKIRYQATQQLGLEAKVLFDVSDAHDGYTARIGADYALPLSAVTSLKLDGGLKYGSDDYNNTYYGVTASEARPGRPAYQPDAGIGSVEAGVTLRHALTNRWSVQGRVGAEYLLSDVADSPLVDEELQPSAMFGVAYTF
ncbi:MAG: MipA/OmpV family protein [Alphaproteobacteria bacterium]|nr:MAG: MipA/OmpV family protein [Alphaproteobacteria bacterium]